MCLAFNYKQLSGGELAKLKSIEGDIGKSIVALQKGESKLAKLSEDDVLRIQALEKEIDAVLLACNK